MQLTTSLIFSAVITASTTALAADPVEQLVPSLVQVEYTLRYDGGQPPRTPGWAERCPSCGRYHIQPGAEYVEDERPMEAAGYLINPTTVVTGDFFLQGRFIESIDVRLGDEVVTATPIAHAIDQYAMMLELDEPFQHGRPLQFDAGAQAPFRSAHWQRTDADWTLELRGVSLDSVILSADGSRRVSPVAARGLIIDREGTPVGLAMNEALPMDDSWRGSPEQWDWVSREELEALFDTTEHNAASTIARVELDFRRGRSSTTSQSFYYYGYGDDDDSSLTELHAIGVLTDEDTMLVLTSLNPRTTARLENITVHLPDDQRVRAEFVGSLRDYGALVIRLEQPQAYPVDFDRQPIQRLGQKLLIANEIELHGQNRVSRIGHTRIAGYDHGWRRNVYPDVAGNTEDLFVFNTDGTLVALPVLRRKPDGDTGRYSRERPTLTSTKQIAAVLDDLDAQFDPVNVPLSEEEELRLAWLGVEMQALDAELARMYNVSEITSQGRTGALVSFVYADSPAAEADIREGDLVLRIHTDRRPRPIDVSAEEDPFAMWGGFPWDYYDDMPEEYFDEMPPPWPTADNAVNRALRDIGFGNKVEVEIHRDEQTKRLTVPVVQSPPHHNAASRHRDEIIGLTLNDLTYEVRRYFQKSTDDPGLVISRIEMGSRASVAGLKPYEIITHINEQPLHSVDDFERILDESTDLRVNVERMHRTRTVRISRPAPERDDDAERDEDADPAPQSDDDGAGEVENDSP